MPTKIFTTARFVLPRRSPENYCRSASLVPTTHPGTVGCFELLADDARHFPQISSFRVSMGELLPKASVSLPKVKPSHRSNPNVVARKNSLLMLLQQYMQARLPQPCRAHAQIEPVNLDGSRESRLPPPKKEGIKSEWSYKKLRIDRRWHLIDCIGKHQREMDFLSYNGTTFDLYQCHVNRSLNHNFTKQATNLIMAYYGITRGCK